MTDLTLTQYLLIGLIFVWSGFVRSGLGFGGAVLSLPFLLLVHDDPLVFLPLIAAHLLLFSSLTVFLNNRAASRPAGDAAAWPEPDALQVSGQALHLIEVFGLIEIGEAGLQPGQPLVVQLQPRGDRRHGAAAFAGGFVELLGCVDALAAGLDLAEKGVGLMLQDVGLGNSRQQGLLFPGLTGFLSGDSLEPVAQLLALVQQGAGLQLLAEIGGQAPVDPQGLLRAGFAPAAVATLRLDLPAELLPCHGVEPLTPELPKLLPLGWAEPAHLELPPARRQQLAQQGRAHSLVGIP